MRSLEHLMTTKYNAREKKRRRLAKVARKQERVKEQIRQGAKKTKA
jgi:hypothetical protein